MEDNLSEMGSSLSENSGSNVSKEIESINGDVGDSWWKENCGMIFLCIIFLVAIGVALYYILKKDDRLGGKSFKCVEGNCKEINKYPDGRKGRYSNLAACKNECNNSEPTYLDSYECQGFGGKRCVRVNKKPDNKTVFQTLENCKAHCLLPNGWTFEDFLNLKKSLIDFMLYKKIDTFFNNNNIEQCKLALNDTSICNDEGLKKINSDILEGLLVLIQKKYKPQDTEKINILLARTDPDHPDDPDDPDNPYISEDFKILMDIVTTNVIPELYEGPWEQQTDGKCYKCPIFDDTQCKYNNTETGNGGLEECMKPTSTERTRRW